MPGKRKQKITPRALMELKMPGEVQVAPDSRRVAYSVSETDWDGNRIAQHLYVTVVSDADAVPRQVTRGRSDESEPRWSPDGKWLAFLAAREEDAEGDYDAGDEDAAKSQVWLLPMDGLGGEAERLTDAPEGVGDYGWLPDSLGVVYMAREPRATPLENAREDRLDRKDDAVVEREEKFREQFWRITVEDKKANLVHTGDLGIGELAVSPDGTLIAFTTNYTGEENDYHRADVWTVEIENGRTRQLTEGPGGKFHPVWRPDGMEVFFTRPLDPALSYSQESLFSVSLSDKSVVHRTQDFAHDLTAWHGVWFDAQGVLYISAAVGTTTGIYRQAPGSDAFTPVVQNDEHIHEFHVAPNGSLAYVASTTTDVPELLWQAADAPEPVSLTNLNNDWLDKYQLAETELASWPSTDGFTIEALLTLPIGYDEEQTYPLIVSLHGGPHGRTVQSLSPFTVAQVWAAEGYAVLSPNYRGSEGYGEAFGIASRADLGGGDFRDVMAGVDWAISEKIAAPNQLGVIGSSYGGYLVNWIVTQTPRFQAAVSQFGIFSLVTDFSNSQAPRWDLEYLGGHPWEVPDLYAKLSPASYVQDVQTPVLILHGEGDGNTFIANSQEMYTALRLQEKTVEFVHYPREGHGFYEPQHRLDEMRRILSWFDKYVRAGGHPSAYRIGDKIIQDGWQLTVSSAALQAYTGREEEDRRYVEVAFVLRDTLERREGLNLGPADVSLTRGLASTGRSGRPIGLPVDVLGQRVLAEGQGWKFVFAPGKQERGLAVAVALTFRITNAGGTYALTVKDFPPVTMDIPAADEKDK